MKKNLPLKIFFLVSFCFSFSDSRSQITITRTDFASIGDMIINAHDTIPTVSAGSAGASQTWNLGGIMNHYSDTTVFSNPSSTPYAANFPTANLAGYNSRDSVYYYVYGSINSIDVVGYVAPNPFTGNALILPFSPPQPQITFSSTMGTTFSNTSTAASGAFYFHALLDSGPPMIEADSFRLTQTTTRTSLIDGWGTTTTTAGTFSSLRQKVIDSTNTVIEAFLIVGGFPTVWQTLPIGGNSVATDYYYLANGQKWAMAHLGTDSAGNISSAEYLVNTVIGIEEYSASGNNDVLFYPNPSKGEVNISVLNNKPAALEMYDMLSRKMETLLLNNNSVTHSFESYPAGLYMFRVLDKKGEFISTGKFVIEK